MQNVRWFYVPDNRLREYLTGRPPFRNVSRYVTGASRGKTYRPNGKHECERRQRQIAAGSLRAENGVCHEA